MKTVARFFKMEIMFLFDDISVFFVAVFFAGLKIFSRGLQWFFGVFIKHFAVFH